MFLASRQPAAHLLEVPRGPPDDARCCSRTIGPSSFSCGFRHRHRPERDGPHNARVAHARGDGCASRRKAQRASCTRPRRAFSLRHDAARDDRAARPIHQGCPLPIAAPHDTERTAGDAVETGRARGPGPSGDVQEPGR
eukprot:4599254-Prymnesium_polylepis.1